MPTKSKSPLFFLAVFLVLLAIHGLGVSAFAYNDPPSRVARLNFIEGDVSFQPGGEQDWVWAGNNRPLTSGDSLWTDQNARAEMHIGSTPIRIGERTALTLLNIDDNTIQIQLNAGSLDIPVRNLYQNQIVEIDTPNSAFTVSRRGHYRVSVDPDSANTFVTVWDGQGEVDGGGQAFLVDSGSQAQISGADSINYDIYDLPGRDNFDQWSDSRTQRESRYQSSRYVSPEMTGYEDLDQDGRWRSDPTYGDVWTPNNVSQDWAPYRQGHWAWVSPWGWTWVDDQPFGFVTSHYGRWAFLNNNGGGGGWGWIPPRREQDDRGQRPVYSPALVMFAGDSNLSNGFGSDGGVAWFPLAPGEVFVPSYQTSPTYITQINVTNTVVQQTVINNIVSNPTRHENYANQKVAGAVTAVPKAVFVNAQPVARAAVKISVAAITAAPVVRSAPVAPVKTSVTGGTATSASSHAGAGASRTAAPPAPPKALVSRAVVAKVAPPPPPVPFAQKQKALAENAGKPLDPGLEQKLRASAPAPVRVVKTAPQAFVVKQAVAAPKPQSMAPAANARPGTPAANKQQPSSQQEADKAHQQQMTQQDQQKAHQQQMAQQEAEKAHQQQVAQQEAEKAHQQQLTQQEEKAHQQQMAQQEAEKAHQQQLTQQEEKAHQQQMTQQEEKAHQQQMAQQEAEKAHQQQLTQQEEKTHQQQVAQQEAEKTRQQQQAQQQQDRRGNPPNNAGSRPGGPPEGQPVRVPEPAQAAKLVSQPKLNPPVDARGAHIQGVVRLQALIGTDGRVKNVAVLSGPPPLHNAAIENVRQRQYQPTQANGRPTEVETEISITFE